MSNIIQYDLFLEKPNETEICRAEVADVREMAHKVRKGLFARHNELAKLYVELLDRMEVIERNICKGEK